MALDGTVLLVAQPSLRRDLDASVAQVQWTSTGYLIAVATLLVVAGRLGDRCGHARLLFTGVLGFGAASVGIALAPTIGWVIALRAAQGVFGALLQPATLALLRLTYPPDRLGTPIAVRTSAIAVAAGAGPVLGGILVQHLGWRAVFWVNVPVALVIAALTLAVRTPVPERAGSHRLDLTGTALLTVALAVLVHTLAACAGARLDRRVDAARTRRRPRPVGGTRPARAPRRTPDRAACRGPVRPCDRGHGTPPGHQRGSVRRPVQSHVLPSGHPASRPARHWPARPSADRAHGPGRARGRRRTAPVRPGAPPSRARLSSWSASRSCRRSVRLAHGRPWQWPSPRSVPGSPR